MGALNTNWSSTLLVTKFSPQLLHLDTKRLPRLGLASSRSYDSLPISMKGKGPNYKQVIMGGGRSKILMVMDPISYNTTEQSSSSEELQENNETLKEDQMVSVHAIESEDNSYAACTAPGAQEEKEESCIERVTMRKNAQQYTYLFAALASSVGITSLAAGSVYYRFAWTMQGREVPWTEMFGTFALALGAAVGMEFWARWAHRALWHASLWNMHQSHHRPREGPFELNDVFAIINAVPAITLMAFGFLHKGLVPGLCFGAGLGITVFGMAYMFVHDGLVHRRFPVGPIADVPYFQRVAAAHQLHHADKFNGVPYGLFLGPMELEEVGGRTELEKLLQKRKREKTNPING